MKIWGNEYAYTLFLNGIEEMEKKNAGHNN